MIDILADASQSRFWRQRLFSSHPGEIHTIDRDNCQELPEYLCSVIQRYELRYSVYVAAASEGPMWLTEGGLLLFKFWASEFPTVHDFSGNNPNVLGTLRPVADCKSRQESDKKS
ncbi:hypothetical protein ACN9MZ_23100 [Pseudoduganella sp. S-14]|uniref:hypothetical protein n=1 Tax=Pseudoduganella sp. S-14 TaxID=3404065 RepID=UPI003CED6758